ncbi:LEAF RUST 10 DISEASE-RESISTANCE LOCUS RECEPTOR-LIKE PROTEIN KINASE-like 2.3 isoform X1 [Salvia divinorum]|uniref:LEAF RUST 10 DISEASE-RESISTANCE LOCUS RECEPTOR-LIKE PROTEIN KINASE-like 2.3 isoform X1 n=1 Tax=Salvia divinorum TaxID=28513 RepID=A0ABD1FJI3_SALDI
MMKCSYVLIVLLLHLFPCCAAKCSPSSCGSISNISSPFRLDGDPKNCGDRRFELRCENNVSSITLNSRHYYVKAINYHNSTIRVADASIVIDDVCSFPTVSAYANNFISFKHAFNFIINLNNPHPLPYLVPLTSLNPINFFSCPNPLKNSSLFTDVTTHCASSLPPNRYAYIKVGHMNASELPRSCRLDLIVTTSWSEFKDLSNVSLSEIHQSLLYGFELVFCPECNIITREFYVSFFFGIIPVLLVIFGLLCAVVSPPVFTIIGFAAVSTLLYYYAPSLFSAVFQPIVLSIICASRIITFPLAAWLLIYKFRTRRLSLHQDIEAYLQSDNKLSPIRYSYSDIKKMTKGFRDKLGQGGYGSVYKGKLRSGHEVAVKLMGKSRGKGQDFMNEIATIGRIHHVNIVKLVGYCAHGSKLALVFDYMTNGSLEKYLFNRDNMNPLNWDTKFEIAVGVARGIEYLHRGCDIQILHFDIKPHNILLDDKFIPKISDFGLAKFCSTGKNTVSLTTARGTIGYVAPELINRSLGAISYKADVYSFGMLLIDMVGMKRDSREKSGQSSQYFPYWIYDCFEQGNDIEIEEAEYDNENESRKGIVKKMTIVALWCILMSPDDRPSMNKVLEMLEGDVERLQIPSRSTQIGMDFDLIEIICSSDSVSLLQHVDASICVETKCQ